MNFNQYSLYSMQLNDLVKNTNESDKLQRCYEKLLKTDSADEVKEILLQAYNIKDANREYVLGDNGFLKITENQYVYSINFEFDDNSYIYSYKK